MCICVCIAWKKKPERLKQSDMLSVRKVSTLLPRLQRACPTCSPLCIRNTQITLCMHRHTHTHLSLSVSSPHTLFIPLAPHTLLFLSVHPSITFPSHDHFLHHLLLLVPQVIYVFMFFFSQCKFSAVSLEPLWQRATNAIRTNHSAPARKWINPQQRWHNSEGVVAAVPSTRTASDTHTQSPSLSNLIYCLATHTVLL